MLIDTHAHLTDNKFSGDLNEVIARAEENGVSAIIDVGESLATSRRCLAHAGQHRNIFSSVGIHPHHAAGASETDLEGIARLADDLTVVAIGETGLDYYRRSASGESQVKLFKRLLQLAIEKGLPVIVHCRDAYADVIALLREAGGEGVRGVLHCFSGNGGDADALLEMGYYISVGGPLTYPGNALLRSIVRHLPLERILVETDCPYLPPQGHRGKRNEPAYLAFVVEGLARLRGSTVAEIESITTSNALKLFNKIRQ
ncbi:MAG: TatD family hydrolase [Candidatus Aureabacteria bacterium]|nr:TatD family hydrolase [Candidatus Auribacterota bacterium]